MVCSNCGYALGPDDQFCGGCGAYLTDAPEAQAAQSDAPDEWAAAFEPGANPEPPRRSRTGLIAGVLAGLLVGVILLVWATNRNSDDADTPAATPPATTGETATTSDSPSEEPTTPEETEDPEPDKIDLPSAATQCNNAGGMTVYRGNDQTSCQFAENVARAYGGLDQPVTEEVTLEDVSSPVTGQSYTLTCDFTSPVRCTGGNNAVIYLSPSS